MQTHVEDGTRLTVGLVASALANLARVLEVDVPAVGLACRVLQCEGEDGIALLDRGFALALVGRQGRVDGIKGLRGRELV